MKVEEKKIDKWDVLVYTDENEVCIALKADGGAIIGANNYADAESKFIEAMGLSDSIRKLLYFKKYGKLPNN